MLVPEEKASIKAKFIMDIINGKYSLDEVKRKIQEYESQYGNDFFLDYNVEQKEPPWDSEYLEELKLKAMCGTAAKSFILHAAEVSEYVNAHKKAEKRKRCVIIGIIVAIILMIIVAGLFVISSSAASLPVEDIQQSASEFCEEAIIYDFDSF